MPIFCISCVWHVGWWNLITSVRLIQVGTMEMTISGTFRCPRPLNRGVRLIKVSFKVNKGNKVGHSVTVRLIEGVRLIRCLLKVSLYKTPYEIHKTRKKLSTTPPDTKTQNYFVEKWERTPPPAVVPTTRG